MPLATAKFRGIDPTNRREFQPKSPTCLANAGHSCFSLVIGFQHQRMRIVSFLVGLFLCSGAVADPAKDPDKNPAPETNPRAMADKAYNRSLAQHEKDPANATVACDFARTSFDLAEFATNSTERASLAEQGITACREVIKKDRDSAPAHYYLGMNLGQLARTKGLGALKIVDEMEKEFSIARELDEHLDYAGPDRNLGLLYRDAPSVGSVGSRSKARKHLLRAAELAPDYPDNGLNLIETCLRWSDRNGARRELKALEAAWPEARSQLIGPTWAASWKDWEERLAKAKKKTAEPSHAMESPREKE